MRALSRRSLASRPSPPPPPPRQTCYVSLLNSFLGLAMYTSYFLLFFALFKTLYLAKKERAADTAEPPPKKAAAARKAETTPPAAPGVESWAIGKGVEMELMAQASSEALDMCSEGL